MILSFRNINYWYVRLTVLHIYHPLISMLTFSILDCSDLTSLPPLFPVRRVYICCFESDLHFYNDYVCIFSFVTWSISSLFSSHGLIIDFLSFVSSLNSCFREAVSPPNSTRHLSPQGTMFIIFTCCAVSGNDYHQHSPLKLDSLLNSAPQLTETNAIDFQGDDNVGFISLQLSKISSCKAACCRFLL